MTKLDIILRVKDRTGCTVREAASYVETVLYHAREAIVSEGVVKIARFGVFEIQHKRERKGRNPITGEAVQIVARRILKFRPSPLLHEAINSQIHAAAAETSQ